MPIFNDNQKNSNAKKPMDTKIAADNMRDLVRDSSLPEKHPEYGKDHIYEMIYKITNGVVTDEKSHRWLGYIQGCVVSYGGATLEDVKSINFNT